MSKALFINLTWRGGLPLDRLVRREQQAEKETYPPVITPRPSFRLSSFKRLWTPLTLTEEQYPLFRNSFDARPTAATVAFETTDIQVLMPPLRSWQLGVGVRSVTRAFSRQLPTIKSLMLRILKGGGMVYVVFY